MTNIPNNFSAMGTDPEDMPHGTPHMDAEVLSLAAELDMLGTADRAALPSGFEDRIMQHTLASLHGVEPVAAQVAELGAADRDAAPNQLEERVFAESVATLREVAPVATATATPILRHTGHQDRTDDRHVRVVRRAWWANQYVRLAAAVVLVAGVGLMVRSAMTPESSKPELTADQRVSRDLDLLFAVIDNRTSGSDSSESPAGTVSDPEELTKFLIEGAAS